ncbi:MAG: malate dehydrogenase, partial [Deltaproteobacteria bacterium]|nr:malate dehydrogenase [Deltaproteobacteria bacterium]
SASAVQMADAILKDKKRILPCCAYLEGEYGLDGIYFGVLVKLGSDGVEQVMEVSLTEEESALVQQSGKAVKESIASLKL